MKDKMQYVENPKTKGSGIITCIPQKGICPNRCPDCFFQSGRSYLEPLIENLPNMPDPFYCYNGFCNRVVRVNDGNDSNVQRERVKDMTMVYPMRFYNTAIPKDLEYFEMPVVLTVNPGEMTDNDFYNYKLSHIPKNLMFVRFRTNTWNLNLCDRAVDYYTKEEIPVVLTFMAYHNKKDIKEIEDYQYRKRTLNSYWAITNSAWLYTMDRYLGNKYVYSCGREGIASQCKFCGNCLREYFATMEILHNET